LGRPTERDLDRHRQYQPETLAMPLDHSRRLQQHHGVQGPRPNPVKPHPEQSVCCEDPKPTWALPPWHGELMSKGHELKFEGGAARKAEREDGKEGEHNRDHTQDGMAAARKSLGLLGVSEF
jgi:hypothetical protein